MSPQVFSVEASLGLVKLYAAPAAAAMRSILEDIRTSGRSRTLNEEPLVLSDNADIFKRILDEPAFQAVVMEHYLERVFAQARALGEYPSA